MCYNQPMEKNFDPLFAAIQAGLHKKNSLTVAIDGPCASGKTSLAAVTQERFNARIRELLERTFIDEGASMAERQVLTFDERAKQLLKVFETIYPLQ